MNAYRFHSVFIWKSSNVNGQRFHLQKRIEMETEQCERSLSVPVKACVIVHIEIRRKLLLNNNRFRPRI